MGGHRMACRTVNAVGARSVRMYLWHCKSVSGLMHEARTAFIEAALTTLDSVLAIFLLWSLVQTPLAQFAKESKSRVYAEVHSYRSHTLRKTVLSHWFPREDLDARSFAFGVQFGGRSDDSATRKISADAWFDRQRAAQFLVREQTFRVARDETVSLVIIDDNAMLDDR